MYVLRVADIRQDSQVREYTLLIDSEFLITAVVQSN